MRRRMVVGAVYTGNGFEFGAPTRGFSFTGSTAWGRCSGLLGGLRTSANGLPVKQTLVPQYAGARQGYQGVQKRRPGGHSKSPSSEVLHMEFIEIGEAARLLGLSKYKLIAAESADGTWTTVDGVRLRVFRVGPMGNARRRYRLSDLLSLPRMRSSGATQDYGR